MSAVTASNVVTPICAADVTRYDRSASYGAVYDQLALDADGANTVHQADRERTYFVVLDFVGRRVGNEELVSKDAEGGGRVTVDDVRGKPEAGDVWVPVRTAQFGLYCVQSAKVADVIGCDRRLCLQSRVVLSL